MLFLNKYFAPYGAIHLTGKSSVWGCSVVFQNWKEKSFCTNSRGNYFLFGPVQFPGGSVPVWRPHLIFKQAQ